MMHAALARETPARLLWSRKRSSNSTRRDGGQATATATTTGLSQQQQRSNSQQNANAASLVDQKPSRLAKKPAVMMVRSGLTQSSSSLLRRPQSRTGSKENKTTTTLRASNSQSRSQLPLSKKKRVSISNYMRKEEGKKEVTGGTMIGPPINETTMSTIESNPSQAYQLSVTGFELASQVFQKAAAKYGARLSHRQVDGLIRKSEHSAQVDKATRKMIKQMLYNYERTGYDATKTVKLELVKIELSRLAREHYRRTMLTKERRQKHPTIYMNRSNCELNTTLQRLLEGVLASSKISELQEFNQNEHTLETDLSETLTSEPALLSPPMLEGMRSPSVNELQSEAMPAFYQGTNAIDKDLGQQNLSKTFLQSTLSIAPVVSDNNFNSSAILFLSGAADGLDIGSGADEPAIPGHSNDRSHVKIANLFQSSVNSMTQNTQQVEKQLEELDVAADRRQTQSSDVDSCGEVIILPEPKTNSHRERRKKAQQTAAGRYSSNKRKQSSEDRDRSRSREKSKDVKPQIIKQQKPKTGKSFKARKLSAPVSEPAITDKPTAQNPLRNKSSEMKNAELDVPVRPECDNFNKTQQTSELAPRFQSCFSSPQSRLRSILTDVVAQAPANHSVHHSHQTSRRMTTQLSSMNQYQQPIESWQSQNQRHMLLLEQGGIYLREKFLKRRAFKSFEATIQALQCLNKKATQFIQSRVLDRLRQNLYERKRQHEINSVFAQSRHDKLIASTFRNWRSLFFECQIVKQCRMRSLLKKGFEALLAGTTTAQQNRQIIIVCRQHFQRKLLKSIMSFWTERAQNNRVYRHKVRRALVDMQVYRMTRIVKGWFNLVDLLKHEHALSSDMLQSRANRLKRHYFVTWLQGYLSLAKRRARYENLAKFSKANFARRYFTPWLRLSRVRNTKRGLFLDMRAKHLVSRAFSALQDNLKSSTGERKRARQVLLLRAERLIRTSFYDGLVAYCQSKRVTSAKKVMAQRHKTEQLTFLCMTNWHAYAQRKRKGRSILAKTNYIMGAKFLSEWLCLAKNLKKAKNFRSKCLFERQFQVLKSLYENANRSKVHSTIIQHCLNGYSTRLLKSSFIALTENINSNKAKRDIVSQIDDYYSQKLRSKAVIAFQHYQSESKIQAKIVNTFQLQQLDKSLAFSFNKFKAYRVERQFQRSYKPYLEHRQALIRERCYAVLVNWTAQKKEMKQKVDGYHSYKREQMMDNVFESLVIHTRYSCEKKNQMVMAEELHRRTLLMKTMETLNLNTECKQNQHALVEAVHRVQRKSIFISWFNTVHNEIPKTSKADDFYLRVKFSAIRALAKRNRGLRAKRTLLKQLSLEYYPYMLKKRGVCKWRAVSDYAVATEERIQLSQKRRLQRLFDGWWNNVDKMAQSKSKDIMQRALNKCFHLRRGMTALSMHANDKRHQKQIIKIYQTKQQMVEKARVFSAIVQHCYDFKIVARKFADMVRPLGMDMLREAFTTWNQNLVLARKDDMANLFQEKRASKFLLRKYFDKLQVGSKLKAKMNAKDDWLGAIRGNHLKRQCLKILAIQAKKSIKNGYAWRLATARSDKQLKYVTMRAFIQFMGESRRLKGIEGNIEHAFNKIRLRKVVLALRSHTARALRGKLMTAKWQLRIKDKFLARWQERFYTASKLRRVCQIFQEQNYLTFIRAFMLKLDDAGEYMGLKKRIDEKLRAKAWQAFKQQWLLGRMGNSLTKRYERDLQVKVFQALRYNQHQRINLRDVITRQVDLQSIEDRFDVARACFDALKQNRYSERAKRIARGTFGLSILRKAFLQLRDWNMKQKLLQVAYQETVITKKHNIFQRWIAEYDKSVKGREANAIINFDRAHMVMDAWKQYVLNVKLVRQFRKETYHKRLKRTGLASLQQNVVIKHFQCMVFENVKRRTDYELMRDAFMGLGAAVRLGKIQQNMKQFHLHMFQKKVLRGWRSFTERNNKKRLDLIQKRAAFRERPYLKKPLLAMRNMLLFRAFRSISHNAKTRQAVRFNRQICTFSLYLRLQRKAFYALRLNAAQIFQKRKSKEIKRLMIQRRWFSYLKRVIRLAKQRRKRQTDAAIFRFLSLQRRGLSQWVNFVTLIKRIRIKRHFSLTLYYNRMCDKVLTALKVNAVVKARKRQDMSSRIDAQGYITTSSSEIMHEASFTHRNKLTMSSLQQFASMTELQQKLQLEHNQVKSEQGFSLAQEQHQVVHQSPIDSQNQTNSHPNHHAQQYNNFYQQPLDQVEDARPNGSTSGIQSQQELIQRTLFQEMAIAQQMQVVNPQTVDDLLAHAHQSLPTPPAQPDFRGFFNHQQDANEYQIYQEQQYNHQLQQDQGSLSPNSNAQQLFNGDMSQPQQLTLGTMPEHQEINQEEQQYLEAQQYWINNMQAEQDAVDGADFHNQIIHPPYYQQSESRPESVALERAVADYYRPSSSLYVDSSTLEQAEDGSHRHNHGHVVHEVNGGYEAAYFSAQDHNVQLEVGEMNLGIGQNTSFDNCSTPEINVMAPIVRKPSYQHSRNVSSSQPRSSNPYSHTSSLKTTPGMVKPQRRSRPGSNEFV